MKSEEQLTGATREEPGGGASLGTLESPAVASPLPPDSSPPDSSTHARLDIAATVHTSQTPAVSSTTKASASTSQPAARGAAHEPMSHERRVLWSALAAGAPGVLVSLALLWAGDYTPKVVWTLAAVVVC